MPRARHRGAAGREPDDGRYAGQPLFTHVLDNAQGIPAAGVTIELWRLDPEPAHIVTTETDKDGRAKQLLLPSDAFRPGRYELRFHIGAYFTRRGIAPDPPYLDVVPVRIGLSAGAGHHTCGTKD